MNGERGGNLKLIILLSLAGLCLVMLLASLTSLATITGDQPPTSGDWLILNPTTVQDEVVNVTGNVSIVSTLTFQRSTLILNPQWDNQTRLEIATSGELVIRDSLVTSNSSDYEYGFFIWGEMTATDTTFEECYMGLFVDSAGDVSLERCAILEPTQGVVTVWNANQVSITDCRIQGNDYVGTTSTYTKGDTSSSIYNYFTVNPMIYAKNGALSVDGLDISINGTLELRNTVERVISSYVYTYNYFTMAMIIVESDEHVDISGVSVRNSRLNMAVYNHVENNVAYSGTVYFYDYYNPYQVLFRDFRDATLGSFSAVNFAFGSPSITRSWSNNSCTVSGSESMYTMKALYTTITETFRSRGPHDIKLTIKDMDYQTGGRILESQFLPGYSGSGNPTFYYSIVLDNFTVNQGSSLFYFYVKTTVNRLHVVNAYVRVSNSTFTNLTGPCTEQYYYEGPASGFNAHGFDMYDTMLIDNCTFRWNNPGSSYGLFYKPSTSGQFNDVWERKLILRNNDFLENNPYYMMYIYGTSSHTEGFQWFIVEGNRFIDNCLASSNYYMFMVYYQSRVIIRNNYFENNAPYYQNYLYYPGGSSNGKKPGICQILNNTFVNCRNTYSSSSYGFFRTYWGGDVEVAYNNITGTPSGSYFFNAYEYTYYAGYYKLDFHHNEVSRNSGSVVYFSGYSNYHPMVTANIHDNYIHDNPGRVVDYYEYATYLESYDYDARISFTHNRAVNCSGTVFANYGDLTVTDNTFIDCGGPVIDIRYLNLHPPAITRNTVQNCVNVYLLAGKPRGAIRMSLSISDLNISCSGVAMQFINMDITLSDVSVSNDTGVAVVATDSDVDIIECDIPIGSGEIDGTGSINAWYNLEIFAEWADATGMSSGKPVDGAMVILHGANGDYYMADFCDDAGHLRPVRVLQWRLRGTAVEQWTPYKVTVAKASLSTSTLVDMNESRVGADAVHLMLVDEYPPFAKIITPFPGTLTSEMNVTVVGFLTERGSGLDQASISVDGGAPMMLEWGEDGEFTIVLESVPTGEVEINLTVMDLAGNPFDTSLSFFVDREPPSLDIEEPLDEQVTNTPFVMVVGTCEPGSTITINEKVIGVSTGTINTRVDLSEGRNLIFITATDEAGNIASVTRNVVVDRLAPALSILEPRDGLLTHTSTLVVRGGCEVGTTLSIKVLSGTRTLSDDTVPMDDEGNFAHTVELEEGVNTIIVTAVDLGTNSIVSTRRVTVDTTPPFCEITSPADGSATREQNVRVLGTAELEGVLLYLNGKQIHNTGQVDRFVRLFEGDNTIELRAVDALGNVYSHTIHVTLDLTPPTLTLTEPASDHIVTNDPEVTIAGVVTGSTGKVKVNEAQVTLDAGGAFETTVTLPGDGVHEIVVSTVDAVGNSVYMIVTVDLSTASPFLEASFTPADRTIRSEEATVYISGTTSELVDHVVVDHTTSEGTSQDTYLVDDDGAFVILIGLAEGDNSIGLQVTDVYGNSNSLPAHQVTFDKVTRGGGGEEEVTFQPQDAGILILVIAITLFVTAVIVTRSFKRR